MGKILFSTIDRQFIELPEGREIEDRESAYGIYIRDKSVLLVECSITGFWGLPGGKVEAGEKHPEALIREIKEETLFDIPKDQLFHLLGKHNEYFYAPVSDKYCDSTMYFYQIDHLGEKNSDQELHHDVSDAKFIGLADLKELQMHPKVREMIVKVSQDKENRESLILRRKD